METTEIAETIHGGNEAHSAEGRDVSEIRRDLPRHRRDAARDHLARWFERNQGDAKRQYPGARYLWVLSVEIHPANCIQTTAEELKAQLLAQPDMPEAVKAKFEDLIKRYRS